MPDSPSLPHICYHNNAVRLFKEFKFHVLKIRKFGDDIEWFRNEDMTKEKGKKIFTGKAHTENITC